MTYNDQLIRDFTRAIREVAEQRASVSDPATADHWNLFVNRSLSASGVDVSPETASNLSTVYACVKILSETIASLPLFLYKRETDGTRKEETKHPVWQIVRNQPNAVQDSFLFLELIVSHLLLHGNAYLYKEYANNGDLIGLWPLNPERVKVMGVESKTGVSLIDGYLYTSINFGEIPYKYNEILHLKDWIADGLIGRSRISQLANTIGASISTEEYAGKFYANSATPSGILTYPGKLSEEGYARAIKTWEDTHRGSGKAQKTALMQAGWEWQPVSISPEDSQLLETRQWQTADIARIFRVPTIMIGGAGNADKSNTFASSEQITLNFVTHTIRPWASRLEHQFNNEFFAPKERQNLFVEFNLEGLLRGDVKTRYETYKTAREWGIMSPNDIRRKENLPPIENGDEYVRPMNMEAIGIKDDSFEEAVDPATALNGAQVTAMLEIVNYVALGIIPKTTGVELILNAFPVGRQQAEAILKDVVKIEPQGEQTPKDKPTEEPEEEPEEVENE